MDLQPNFRRNLFLSVLLAIAAGFILSSVYLWMATDRQAKLETLKFGDSLALQSEVLIRPLLLSNDRVSLNYLLNELIQVEHISGLQVQDRNGIVIARAGETSDIKQIRRFLLQEQSIGSFTLWLSDSPSKALLSSQHIPLAILAAMTGLFVLLALWYLTRQSTTIPALNESPGDDDFSAALTQQEQERGYIQPASEHTPVPEVENSTFSSTTENAQLFTSERTEPEASTEKQLPSNQDKQENQLHTNDLVDLLKPERNLAPKMPKFEHHPQDLEQDTSSAEEETLIFEEQELSDLQAPTEPARENPLFKMQERKEKEEQQLELYSFEQELELILPPQDAIYLFYIDTLTASSDNIVGEEKAALVNVYYHLAKQVARIYGGETEQLENSDILMRFEMRDDKDSHGINALCAAMLFCLLYKGFNQSRIKGFQPVLSLQMSVTRGHHSRYNLVQEEAHFLTRTTHSNELISHTALTETPIIKQSLLEDADIRREDEDKVLIMKLTAKHQALLQKQANHLLTKIFKK